jgi:hypothetical protein
MDDLDLAICKNRIINVAGLCRDHSCKPVYDELLKLIEGEWWISPW